MHTPDDNTPQLRDHVYDGIQEYDQKLPNWWLFTWYITIVFFVIYWFGYYQLKMLSTDEEIIDTAIAKVDEVRKKELASIDDAKLWAMSKDPTVVSAGKAVFMTPGMCVACHGADAMAKKTHPENLALVGLPLADQEWKYGGKPMEVLTVVRKGSPDVTKGMPPWEPVLGSKKAIEVTAYIMSLHKEGEPITAAPDSPPAAGGAAAPAAGSPAPAPAASAAPAAGAPLTPMPAVAPTTLEGQIAEGQKVYMSVCFACHQPTGAGLPGMFPPLAGSDWVTAPKPDRIIRFVLQGINGPLTLNGKPFTTPAPIMPPQGAVLNDSQIAWVLTYVRNSFGNKADAVTPEQVKAIRDSEKRATPWTEADIKAIPDR